MSQDLNQLESKFVRQTQLLEDLAETFKVAIGRCAEVTLFSLTRRCQSVHAGPSDQPWNLSVDRGGQKSKGQILFDQTF